MNERSGVEVRADEPEFWVGDYFDVDNGWVFILFEDSNAVLNDDAHGLGDEVPPGERTVDGEISCVAQRRVRSTLLVHINIKGQLKWELAVVSS